MQVELAQLQYMLPRLTRMWAHLEKFRGGIGVRGPGETQLETDRRLINQRIKLLKNRLGEVQKSREVQRAQFTESSGNREAARRHFLAAAHLELVLAHDYEEAGEPDLALRSRISSATCLWSASQIEPGRQALEKLQGQYPAQAKEIQQLIAELIRDYPPAP